MSEIQRYKRWVNHSQILSAMVTEKDGEWVKYADHAAAIRQARVDIAECMNKVVCENCPYPDIIRAEAVKE